MPTSPCRSQDDPDQLLQYYKQRVDEFETERADLLRRITTCSASASESHSLRCAAQKRSEEVRELQQALSAAHMHLFEERDRLLRLQAENDDLRLQAADDQRRIQHLTALTHPVDQEVTLSRGAEPSSGLLYPRAGKRRGQSPDGVSGGASQRVLRTVYLPAANADALQLRVESLQAQLAEQQQFAAERVEALVQDRTLRDQDDQAHRQNYQQQIEELTGKVKRMEEALRATTTDYIVCRRDKQDADARAAAAEQRLADTTRASSSKLAATKQGLEERIERLEREHGAALAKEAAGASRQLKAREMELGQLETMHAAVKEQLEARVRDLEGKLGKSKDALRHSEQRRAMDAEGFTHDVSNLRKQLAAVDRKLHAMRLQARLDDDERLEALLRKVDRKGAPRAEGVENGKGRKGTKGALGDLKAVRQGLQGIEKRLHRDVLQPAANGS